MGATTNIEWTDATWNPWMGCTKVSPACQNCYAERDMKRYGRDFSKLTRTSDKTFNSPNTWKDPKKIFVCSWSDFFHKDVDPQWRRDAMVIMERNPHHTFILLTKRPENIMPMLCGPHGRWGGIGGIPKNIWIGCTVENQEQADLRIPLLMKVPASLRFLSCEPLVGPINFDHINGALLHKDVEFHDEVPGGAYEQIYDQGMIDWVIVGGESGPKARPLHPDWVRGILKQCKEAYVPFLFKQWGEWAPVLRDADVRVKNQDNPDWYNWPDEGWSSPVSLKVGRKKSGCELNGKTYKEFPNGQGKGQVVPQEPKGV